MVFPDFANFLRIGRLNIGRIISERTEGFLANFIRIGLKIGRFIA